MSNVPVASVNPNGDSCPYALLVMAVQLLNEITTFLRESHQHATRSQMANSTSSATTPARGAEHSNQWDGAGGVGGAGGRRNHGNSALKSTRRRLSILMPMFVQSDGKEKHNSVYTDLSNIRSEDGDTTSRATDDYGKLYVKVNVGEKRISRIHA